MAEATATAKDEAINWANKSVEYRTPRQFISKPTDVTVVVGGVKFFHYEAFLSSNCDFFDQMLASQMKESKTATIEFPDKDPGEWMEVYKFLDPMNNYIGLDQSPSSLITYSNVEMLMSWFDYLGMERHLAECDQVLSNRIYSTVKRNTLGLQESNILRLQEPFSYERWENVKDDPHLPKTRGAIIMRVKHLSHEIVRDVASHQEQFEEFKRFLMDKDCGDDVWSYFIGCVVDLPQDMLDNLDRHTIVSSETFGYMVAKWCKPVSQIEKKHTHASSSSESSDDSEVYSYRPSRRIKRWRRGRVGSISDSDYGRGRRR